MVLRKIVEIDEARCNGCGECVPSCAEGAIRVVHGKARLVSDVYCDGLGACLGHCPQGAIFVVEREADAFDGAAVQRNLAEATPARRHAAPTSSCPGSSARTFGLDVIEPVSSPQLSPDGRGGMMDAPSQMPSPGEKGGLAANPSRAERTSALRHWPIQLRLVPPGAPFLRDADVILAAHCVPFALADFHERFLDGRALLIACPKLDDVRAHLDRLAAILAQTPIKSLTVVRMEVPCCVGLVRIAHAAIERSGGEVPFGEAVVSTRGQVFKG